VADDLDPGIGLPASGPPEVAAVDSATPRSGAIVTGAARPWNPEGDPAIEAPRHGPTQDNVDSAQASNETHPVPFELSRPSAGGRGGEGVAGPTPGLGNSAHSPRRGRGQGGTPHAVALDPDGGLSTHARQQDAYFRKLYRKLRDSLTFPPNLAAALEQGSVVVTFTLREDGSVDNVRVVRGSGFAEFDQAAMLAVEKAAPFDRMPAATFGGRRSVEVTAPIRFANPLIR
jgi:TonB family protein